MKKLGIVFLISISLANVGREQTIEGSFIAMQYKGLSNLVYRVFVTKRHITAVKVNGYITIKNPYGIGYVVPEPLRKDPQAYVNPSMEKPYKGINPDSDTILQMNEENFMINRPEVKKIYNNPEKKWGMGNYPYSGRIIIVSPKTEKNKKKKRELILIGDQNVSEIMTLLK